MASEDEDAQLGASASMPNLPPIDGAFGSTSSTMGMPDAIDKALDGAATTDAFPSKPADAMAATAPGMAPADSEEEAKKALLSKSKSTPAPGQYFWNDDVNLKKRPVWKLQSPDRSQLDLMLQTWTPASRSLQPRAPDPGEYGDVSIVGYNGVFGAPKWTWEKGSIRPCLQPNPPQKAELVFKIKPSLGGRQPVKRTLPSWSVSGKDRSKLPTDLPTWTPKPSTDLRPGPGQYDLDRTGKKWKAVTRRGCTWGGRTANLHPDERAWVPMTRGSRLCGGENSRLRSMNVPSTRCACVTCPGPGRCDDSLS